MKKIIDKGKIKLYNMQVLFEGQLNIAELCKGSTADSDSVCLGSNPSSATKNRQGSTESCRFYLLPIHSSLFPKKPCRFLEVIGNSE